MRHIKTVVVATFFLLLCFANWYLMHKHQHLEEALEEMDIELKRAKGSRKDKVNLDLRQGTAGTTPIGAVNALPAPPPAFLPLPAAKGGQAGSETDERWKKQVAELQAQLAELPHLRNKSSTLEYLNEDLEEKVEDLEKEIGEKSKAIEYYVGKEKEKQTLGTPAPVASNGQAIPAAAPGVKVRVGREKYQKVRDQLGLDDDIVITGSAGPPHCSLFCNSGGFLSGCPPQCVFKAPIIVPGIKATACIFNGHRLADIPEDIREYGCIPVGEGMESEVNYHSLTRHREDPETWTRTYRRDADAPAPYYSPQEVRLRHPQATRPLKDRIRGAVAVISNCKPAERKEAIRILRQHIRVDFLGKCGDGQWPEDCEGRKCQKLDVLTNYMVYLAFENSHTQDYATEKLYDGLSTNSVTVAFGAPNSLELVPRNSIINIASVQEADAVGKRLKAMLDDPELKEANRITQWHMDMAWRAEWEEKMSFTRLHSDCRLCETLRRRVVVATGGDRLSFALLKHTVAAVQKWEQGRPLMVFDMGLNEWQKDQVRAWASCALVEMSEYSLGQSWKLRVHAIMFAVHAAGKALWLDAGMELQGRLAAVDVAMERHGLFLAEEGPSVGGAVRGTTLFDLGLNPDKARTELPLLSAAVQGHSDAGLPYERVLVPVAQCVAQDLTCAAGGPVNASEAPLPDQGVLSVVAATAGTMLHAADNARLAFGNASAPGLLKRREWSSAPPALVFRRGACVHAAGRPGEPQTVAHYAYRGSHKVRAKAGEAASFMHARDLEACSEQHKDDVTVKDHAKDLVADVLRWTMKGLAVQFDMDVPRNDMATGQFMHVPHNRKSSLLDCAKECWLNPGCLAFSYDQEGGECWPKTQPHKPVPKSGIACSTVDVAIRNSKTPEEWLALWGTKNLNSNLPVPVAAAAAVQAANLNATGTGPGTRRPPSR